MCRAPFPKVSERVTARSQLIHSDICGLMRVASHGKKQYFATFIDDFSEWCEVRFISQKNHVISEFESFRALVSTQHGKTIKCLQSDNGREYVNQEFDQLLRRHSILRRLTAPYNLEQNGVAERRNRTLMEMARCLLIQLGLPPTFWAEAVNTANYIRNRSPTSKLKGRTPHKELFGKPPDVSIFRRFGSRYSSWTDHQARENWRHGQGRGSLWDTARNRKRTRYGYRRRKGSRRPGMSVSWMEFQFSRLIIGRISSRRISHVKRYRVH